MPPTWKYVESSESYKGLDSTGRAEVKRRFYRNVISASESFQALDPDGRTEVGKRFFREELKGGRSITDILRWAVTPIPAIETRLTTAAEAVEKADAFTPKKPAGGPVAAALGAIPATLVAPLAPFKRLTEPGQSISLPKIAAAAISPTPLDVATFGIGTMAKALRAAGLVGRTAQAAEVAGAAAKAAEAAPVPVRTIEEAVSRIEAAAAKAPKQPTILLPRSPGPIPDEIVGSNLAKFDTTEDAKRLIADMAATNRTAIDEARRGVIGESALRRLAHVQGVSKDEMLRRIPGGRVRPEDALASEQALVRSAEDLQEAAVAAAQGRRSLADLSKMAQTHVAVQTATGGIRAEFGRGLGAYRYVVGGRYAEAVKTFLEKQGAEFTQEMVEKLASLGKDPRAVNAFMRDMVEGTFGEKLVYARTAAMLTNPATHIVNSTSNAVFLLARPLVERPGRVAADIVRSLATGTPRERFVGEIAADLFGIIQGIPEGASAALRTLTDGLSQFGTLRTAEAVKAGAPPIKGVAGKAVSIPFRLLGAADEFFKSVGASGELSALAYRDGVKKGLSGRALANHVAAITTRSSSEADKFIKLAFDEARYRTFQSELGSIAKKGAALRDAVNVAGVPVGRLILPFYATPINIAKVGLEWTPANFVNLVMKHGLGPLVTKPELVDELVKPMIGTLAAVPLVKLAGEGTITGGGPTDPGRQAVYKTAGIRPYSVKIGDRYYGYSRIEPLATTLGMIADYAEFRDLVDTDDAVAKIGTSISKNLGNKTFLTGIAQLLGAISEPDRRGPAFVRSLAASAVPAGVAAITRAQEGVLRQPTTPGEAIRARLPGAGEDVPVLRTLWGEPVTIQGGPIGRMLNPIYLSDAAKDKATTELVRLKISQQLPTKRLGDIELSSKELDTYAEMSGKKVKMLVDQFVNSSGYDGLADVAKSEGFKRRFSIAREQTAAFMGLPQRQREARLSKARQ